MKALVFSDIHGSLGSAHFIEKMMEEMQPDFLFLLGDLLYHGPRNPLAADYDPKGVSEILNNFCDRIVAVRGNCDSEVDAMILSFPLSPTFSWCISDGMRCFLTHGHTMTPKDHPPLRKGDAMLSGHTHVPTAEEIDGIFYCNPGSITLPKRGNPASFGILDSKTFSVLKTDGQCYLHLAFC